MARIAAIALELIVGAALVCSEAHTLPEAERVAVAASVRSRVLETGRPAVALMRAPRQYAPHLCPLVRLESSHFRAYATGRLGLGPEWTRGVHSFYHRRLDSRLRETWSRRGLRVVDSGDTRHVYWRRR